MTLIEQLKNFDRLPDGPAKKILAAFKDVKEGKIKNFPKPETQYVNSYTKNENQQFKPDWKLLNKNKCPKCGHDLTNGDKGLIVCTLGDFSIRREKFEQFTGKSQGFNTGSEKSKFNGFINNFKQQKYGG